MKIFFDLGHHRGQGLRAATNRLGINAEEWKVYCFEPNPISARNIPSGPNIWKMPYVVWDEDTELMLAMEKGWGHEYDGWGSSVMEKWEHGKVNKNPWGEEKVKAIFFVRFLLEQTDPKDEVYIKMDIEGAEYPVIRSMLRYDELWPRIKELDVEFHHRFLPDEDVETTDILICALNNRTKLTIHG